MSKILELQKEQLMKDLHAVISDSEALLKTSAHISEDALNETKSQIQERLNNVKHNLKQLQNHAIQKVEALGQEADHYVHENPWKAIGIAGGFGLLLGFLLVRR